MSKNSKIIKFHPHFQLNIGIIMCIILFIYVIFHIFTYLISDNISVYEVNEGSINNSYSYNALCIREEKLIKATSSGTINYYQHSNSRVGRKTVLYSIDKTGDTASLLSDSDTSFEEISSSDKQNLINNISSFVNDYDNSNYYKTNTFKTDLSSTLNQVYTNQAISDNKKALKKAKESGNFEIKKSPEAGLFMMSYDGMEDTTIDNFTKSSFNSNNSKKKIFLANTKVKSDEAIGRLITSNTWYCLVKVNNSTAKKLKDEEYIQVKFNQDNETSWAESSIVEKSGKYYLQLKFSNSMERYADSRYLSIELLLDQANGLKIPNSAIVEKEFFTVPKEYFLAGDDSNDLGLIVKNSKGNEFISPTIYYENDDYYYIDSEDISADDIIIIPNSTNTYKVSAETDNLKGVYNINRGYAVFKQIEILQQSNDYTIVKKGTDYGIALYDHIVLDGTSVDENQIIN